MSAKTAADAFEELRKAGLLDSERLCISVYAKRGDIGSLRIDIENGRNSLSPSGKDETAYIEIVENLPRTDIVALASLLNAYYSKSL